MSDAGSYAVLGVVALAGALIAVVRRRRARHDRTAKQ